MKMNKYMYWNIVMITQNINFNRGMESTCVRLISMDQNLVAILIVCA